MGLFDCEFACTGSEDSATCLIAFALDTLYIREHSFYQTCFDFIGLRCKVFVWGCLFVWVGKSLIRDTGYSEILN